MTQRDYSALLTRIGRLERRVTKSTSPEALELYTLKAAAIAVAEGYASASELNLDRRT